MAIFDDENAIDWDNFFQAQIIQSGHGVFQGYPYQRGFGNRSLRGHGIGNIFRSLFRILAPVAKRVGKAVGKQAFKTGAEIATDVVAGDNFKESFKRRGKVGVENLINKGVSKLKGDGIGSRKRRREPAARLRGRRSPIKIGVLKKRRKVTQLFGDFKSDEEDEK